MGGAFVHLGFMAEVGLGRPRPMKVRPGGLDSGCFQAFKAFLSFSITKVHGTSVTPFLQRIN